jgi:hypothetical protein
MKKGIWAIIIAILLALIAFAIYFTENTDQKFGTIGAPIAFTLYYEEGDEDWMPIFEAQLDKWNNIHNVFSVKEKIKITSSTPVIASQNDGINAIYRGLLPGYTVDLAPARTKTDTPVDGKLYGGDIAFGKGLNLEELEKGECTIGYQPPIQGIAPKLVPSFSQVALHELSHFIGLNHSGGANIANVNIIMDSDLRALDKKLWNMIAFTNFNVTTNYFDCGVFRGFQYYEAEFKCPVAIPNDVYPNTDFVLKNVVVENLGSSPQTFEVNYFMFPVNDPNGPTQLLRDKEYQLEAYSSQLHDVSLKTPSGFYFGEYYIKAIILNHDDDISNNEVILAKINILRPILVPP